VNAPFELDWLGGWSERRLRKRRPGLDALPWTTLDPSALDPDDVLEARRVWSNGVFTEYASAAAFGSLGTALLECGAPVDLSAVACDIVVDELDHVELVSRLVMALGGGVPYHADLSRVSQVTTPDATPLIRALELAITTSCVGEALSLPALVKSRALTQQPLIKSVLDRLIRDEGSHAEIGPRILAWAEPRLSAGDREHLAAIAMASIASYAGLWRRDDCDTCAAPAIGIATAPDYRALMRSAIHTRIVARLARFDILITADALATQGIYA
jgi:hypothetical protein